MSIGQKVNLIPGPPPDRYHCHCDYCLKSLGELRHADGAYYNRLERRAYYAKEEQGGEGHVAKTPLHIARWAIQAYTKPGDWVLDPTIGAGTTAVEAITQGRNVAGMEIQFSDILNANIRNASEKFPDAEAKIRIGDARTISNFLEHINKDYFSLIVNNPPYSGDEHMSTLAADKGRHQSGTFKYQSGLPNLAFLKEGQEYWDTIRDIYAGCISHLRPGGHFVIGVKDMMRSKKPFTIHDKYAAILDSLGLEHIGTAFLKHHPTTLHLNTYEKMYGVPPPLYQTITIHRKKGGEL